MLVETAVVETAVVETAVERSLRTVRTVATVITRLATAPLQLIRGVLMSRVALVVLLLLLLLIARYKGVLRRILLVLALLLWRILTLRVCHRRVREHWGVWIGHLNASIAVPWL